VCSIRPGGGGTREETVVVAVQTVAGLVPEVVKALPRADNGGNNMVGHGRRSWLDLIQERERVEAL
jgi:hypothetical protein